MRTTILIAAAAIAAGSGCYGSDAKKATDRAQATVGVQGGSVALDGVRLDVPAGALDAPVTIIVTSTAEPPPPEVSGPATPVYRFEPEGTRFNVPVTVSIPAPSGLAAPVIYWESPPGYAAFKNAPARGGPPADVTATFANGGQPEPSFVPLATRVEAGRLVATSQHFSRVIAGANAAIDAPQSSVTPALPWVQADASHAATVVLTLRTSTGAALAGRWAALTVTEPGMAPWTFYDVTGADGSFSLTYGSPRPGDHLYAGAFWSEAAEGDCWSSCFPACSGADPLPAICSTTCVPLCAVAQAAGWVPFGSSSATFVSQLDECAVGQDDCSIDALCTDTPDGWSCGCRAGYSGDGHACADEDECLAATATCSPNAICTNLPGSYGCACITGFTGDGHTCLDVDECTLVNSCAQPAGCENTPGSYLCHCLTGYTGDGQTCLDVDECAVPGTCGPNATCTNQPGTYGCACDPGYAGLPGFCADVDECATPGTCDLHATCQNLPASYACTCDPGWTGDGHNCADVDECLVNNGGCAPDAFCQNVPGTRLCTCGPGFTPVGVNCVDVDECSGAIPPCDLNASCTNSVGSFSCACNAGWAGSGLTCVPEAPPVQPWDLALTPVGPSAHLTWTGHPTSSSYNVYGSTSAGLWTLIAPSATTSANVGLAAGFVNSFRVTAVNGLGESAPSTEVSISYPYRDVVQSTSNYEQPIRSSEPLLQSFTIGVAGTLATVELLLNNPMGDGSPDDLVRVTVYDAAGTALGHEDRSAQLSTSVGPFTELDGPGLFHFEALGIAVAPGQAYKFGVEIIRASTVPCILTEVGPQCGGVGPWCWSGYDYECNPVWNLKAASYGVPGGLTVNGAAAGDLTFRVAVM